MSEKFSRRRLLAKLATVGASLALAGCMATNRATGRSSFTGTYSVEDDIALGRREHPKLVEAFGGEYGDPRLQRYVSRVGQSLALNTEYQEYPYTFTLLNSPIVNAFALPGGFVYVSRGLLALASNEAELAGVLSHELGHVNARHSAERMSASTLAQIGVIAGAIGAAVVGLPSQIVRAGQQIAALSIQSYSRKQEFEADTLGVRYMSKAGYDPEAMVTFLSTLREQSIVEAKTLGLPAGTVDQFNMMSTHPRTVDRVREATDAAAVQRPDDPLIGREQYLAQIDGMAFGDDPKQGIVIGQRFVHPGMRFEFTVPVGFRTRNMPERVVAEDSAGAGIVFDIGAVRGDLDMAGYASREWVPQLELREVSRMTVNGLEAGSGWAQLKSGGRQVVARFVAIRRDSNSAFRLVFVAPAERARAVQDDFQRTTESFRLLSPAEAAAVKPLRLRIAAADPGDRVSGLSGSLPYGAYNDEWFRVMNDMEAGAEPIAGQTLKVVRA